jgi:NADH dehydrogenase
MGQHAGRCIRRDLALHARAPFAYFNKGDLATIGRHRAVAAIGALHLQGYIAWLAWLFIHILYLVGFRNRLTVLVQWAYQYFTYQRGVRLITGTTTHRLLKSSRERAHERAHERALAGATAAGKDIAA